MAAPLTDGPGFSKYRAPSVIKKELIRLRARRKAIDALVSPTKEHSYERDQIERDIARLERELARDWAPKGWSA